MNLFVAAVAHFSKLPDDKQQKETEWEAPRRGERKQLSIVSPDSEPPDVKSSECGRPAANKLETSQGSDESSGALQ